MYRVTIQKIEDVNKIEQQWHKLSDKGNEKDDGPTYGYVDQAVTETIATEVFKQTVDDIDLPAVIKAVNGMDA